MKEFTSSLPNSSAIIVGYLFVQLARSSHTSYTYVYLNKTLRRFCSFTCGFCDSARAGRAFTICFSLLLLDVAVEIIFSDAFDAFDDSYDSLGGGGFEFGVISDHLRMTPFVPEDAASPDRSREWLEHKPPFVGSPLLPRGRSVFRKPSNRLPFFEGTLPGGEAPPESPRAGSWSC